MNAKLSIVAWLVVLAWLCDVAFTWYSARWTGLVIACTGLIATAFVLGAFYSRSRKRSYPDKQHWPVR